MCLPLETNTTQENKQTITYHFTSKICHKKYKTKIEGDNLQQDKNPSILSYFQDPHSASRE
jgi:hypothetical protein